MSAVLFALLIVQPPQDPNLNLELGKLKGTWTIASLHIDGKENTAGFREVRFVFNGQTLFLTDKNGTVLRRENGKIEERAFNLDQTTTPKTIDLTISEKFQSLGIYEVNNDEMKMCTAEPGQPRPVEFKAKQGVSLVMLKREKK